MESVSCKRRRGSGKQKLVRYVCTCTLSLYLRLYPLATPPVSSTRAKGLNCTLGIKIVLIKYWSWTWQNVRKILLLFLCFILARWAMFSNNTLRNQQQFNAVGQSPSAGSTRHRATSAGMCTSHEPAGKFKCVACLCVTRSLALMVYLPTDPTKHDTNSLLVRGSQRPERMLYLSLQVYLIFPPTGIKNDTVSRQSQSKPINGLIGR